MTDEPTPLDPMDDELLGHVRAALDEAAVVPPSSAAPEERPVDRRRWLAVAAAAVLVAGGVAAVAVNLSGSSATPATVPTSGPTSAPTSAPTSTTNGDTADGAVWFEIRHPDFTPQTPELRLCCPPTPAPGPAVVMAWAAATGVDDGLLALTATPRVDGTTDLAFEWSGMTDERAAELQAEVVPGSGVPYVLDDPSMQLVGNGLSGMGELATQAFLESDGSLELRVGDYAGQLDWLTSYPSTPIDVLGRPGHRMSTEGGIVVLWQLENGDWAELLVNTHDAAATGDESRFDAIMASLSPAPLPTFQVDVTTTTTSGTGSTVYRGNVAGIIDNGDGRGPMLTFYWLDSLPPQGGSLPLAAFDWDMVDGEETLGGVTWSGEPLGLVGTYDGTTFTLTEPPQPPFTFTDDLLTYGTLTEGCTDADIAPMLEALQALDHQALGIIESSDYRWDGHCGVQLMALFDTPALRDAISALGDDVMVRIAFTVVTA